MDIRACQQQTHKRELQGGSICHVLFPCLLILNPPQLLQVAYYKLKYNWRAPPLNIRNILYKCRQPCVYVSYFSSSPLPLFSLSSFVFALFLIRLLVGCLRPGADTALWLAGGRERRGLLAPVQFFRQEALPSAQFRQEPVDGTSDGAALVNV